MITYREFLNTVAHGLTDYMPDYFADCEIEVARTEKCLGESYDGIRVRPINAQCGICINLIDVYHGIDREDEIEQALPIVADEIMRAIDERPEHLDNAVDDYDFFKNHLTMQLASNRINCLGLKDIPYTRFGDMVVIYRIVVDQEGDGVLSAVVTNSLLDAHNLNADQLHELALRNAPVIRPMDIVDLKDGIYLLSHSGRVNGAACMLYPDFPAYAAKVIESNFYLLPFSVNTVLLVKDIGNMPMGFLRDISLRLATFGMKKEERLSKEIYYCDIFNGTIMKAENYVN